MYIGTPVLFLLITCYVFRPGARRNTGGTHRVHSKEDKEQLSLKRQRPVADIEAIKREAKISSEEQRPSLEDIWKEIRQAVAEVLITE